MERAGSQRYQAALVNYAFLAHGVVWTEDVVSALQTAG